jgi:hypothetical protein
MTKTDASAAGAELLLKARNKIRITRHDPGSIRLRFSPTILKLVPELSSEAERANLSSIPGIGDVKANLMTCSLTIGYDPKVIAPESWEIVVLGSEEEARRLLEDLCNQSDK